MTTNFLAAGQLQLLNHVTAWGALRIPEICLDPFTAAAGQRGHSSVPAPLPSELALRYLDRIRQTEASLYTPLGLNYAEIEKMIYAKPGLTLNNYLLSQNPPWLTGAMHMMGRAVVDDLWQLRQARMNVQERVNRWKRVFGSTENSDSRPNVAGFQTNLTWLQETYSLRNFLYAQLSRKLRPGWELVEAFYDPAQRAAQNILDGAAALRKYHKVNAG